MIRDARETDLPAIVRIYNEAIPGRMATADTEPVTVASRRAWLLEREPRHPAWVCERNGDVAGWLTLGKFYGRPAYASTVEVSVYVAAHARGTGIATALLNQALTRAPALGLTTFLGFVFAHNGASLALCEKHGFARWGELPRIAVLDGIERDLLILGKRLDAPPP